MLLYDYTEITAMFLLFYLHYILYIFFPMAVELLTVWLNFLLPDSAFTAVLNVQVRILFKKE